MKKSESSLGRGYKGILIEDPVLEPYFILQDQIGAFLVNRRKKTGKGEETFIVMNYPSSFLGCLNSIAKFQLMDKNSHFDSVQKYIDAWKEISSRILEAYQSWNIENI
jgi:hypothetical protein